MTIFQHTLDKVLSGEKTQTARIWKDSYRVGDYGNYFDEDYQHLGAEGIEVLWSVTSSGSRRLCREGQIRSVQPGRGKKGVARIRILKLWKQDVRDYLIDDIRCEGFLDSEPLVAQCGFFDVWCKMHDMKAYDFGQHNYNYSSEYLSFISYRPVELYTALCIKFELIDVVSKQ